MQTQKTIDKIKRYWPYQIIVLLFIASAYLFTPQVFQDKVVNQSDISSWRGMANEIIAYNEANPKEDPALWTNSMFSGMPATTISVIYEGDYTDYIYKAIHRLAGKRPPSYLLISLLGSFLLFMAFGVNIWLSALGAFAITLCSYNLQIIQVGHNSKMVAIAFMPWVLAALVYAYRRKPYLGALLFAFAMSFQIKANHPQITYYLAIIVIGFALAQLYQSIKEKYFAKFLKTSALLLVAGLIGIAVNINHLWPTYEYSKYTMRGGSQLAKEQGKNQEGLDIAYATSWSYSLGEMPNLMIPNFNGGSSSGELSRNSETYKALQKAGYNGADQIIKQMPLYWGPQPFTAGPMYMGAISVFLFILGLILIRGPEKWWIAAVSLLAVLLSWGSNFQFLTEFFFNYMPLYNKFRTVSMILVILQITIPLLAILTLNKLLFNKESSTRESSIKEKGVKESSIKESGLEKNKVKNALLISIGITAGISLLFALVPAIAGSFVSNADGQLPEVLRGALVSDRMSLLRKDAIISALFIIAAGSVIWLVYLGKLKRNLAIGIISFLVITNLWTTGHRYLNDSHFIKNREFENQYALRPVDKAILEDQDPNYRVLDLSVNTFNDAHVSYHHKTIGGYSPAKLQIYQDMIDMHITKEMAQFGQDIAQCRTVEEVEEAMGDYPVLNMLNTKYFILGADNMPVINKRAFGNAWFASQVVEATTLNQEISLLSSGIDLSHTAVVHTNFIAQTAGVSKDVLAADNSQETLVGDELIVLTSYSPNKLTYQYNSLEQRLAVFSEIYYPAGWKAYIDGQPVPIIKANYILRALNVPAGSHTIEFEFKPESFTKGALYSSIASGILIVLSLLLALAAFFDKTGRKLVRGKNH